MCKAFTLRSPFCHQISCHQVPLLSHRAPPLYRQLTEGCATVSTDVFLRRFKAFLLPFFLLNKKCNLYHISWCQRWSYFLFASILLKEIPI